MELSADRLSKTNYDDSCRRPEAQSNDYFVQDIGAFYNEANAYSETNHQQTIDNHKLEFEALAAGNVRPNVWTTHLNCDARHSLVYAAPPEFDGKKFHVVFSAIYYIRRKIVKECVEFGWLSNGVRIMTEEKNTHKWERIKKFNSIHCSSHSCLHLSSQLKIKTNQTKPQSTSIDL